MVEENRMRDAWPQPNLLSGGYTYDGASVGFLGNKSNMDNPQQQLSFSSKTMADFGVPGQEFMGTIINSPSVRSQGSDHWADIQIRGIRQSGYDYRLNGIPGMFIQSNMPTSFVDRIDITSGPGMGVRGSYARTGGGGGVIDMISKAAPEDHDVSNYTQTFSGRSTLAESIDMSRRFGADNSWGIRVNGLYRDGINAIPGEKERVKEYFVNLDHKDQKSKTNILAGYRDWDIENAVRSFSFGKYRGTSLPHAPDADKNYSYPGNEYGMRTTILAVNHEQNITDKTSFFINAGYGYNKAPVYSHSGYTVLDETGNFAGSSYPITSAPYAIRSRYFQGGLKTDFNLGAVKNEMVFAYDATRLDSYWNNKTTGTGIMLPGGNIYDFPEFSGSMTPSTGLVYSGSNKSFGLSAVDTITYKKLILEAGVHHHRFSYGEPFGDAITTSDTSPLFGLVYKPSDHVSLYANHSEYFSKGSFLSPEDYVNPGLVPPLKTKSDEIGVKYLNGGFLSTISLFNMKVTRQMDYDLPNTEKKLAVINGYNKYRGIEWTFNGRVAPKWDVIGGLTYLDTKQESNDFYNGKEINGTPHWSAVAGAIYKPNDELSLIGRIRFMGDTSFYAKPKDSYVKVHAPSYTIFDLGVKYKTDVMDQPVTLTAMLYNAFGKDYWQLSGNSANLGNPRTFMLSASFDF